MNKQLRILTVASALCAGLTFSTATAAEKTEKEGDKHEHAHKQQGGPNGGRLLETEPHAEFFVEKDRNVTIRFFSDALKPVAATEQTVTVLAEAKDGKTKVEFEKVGEALKSKTKLPDGDGYNLVVQVRARADAKPQNFRFKLDLATCGECKRAEYACICEH
jgi:hypothetical protein